MKQLDESAIVNAYTSGLSVNAICNKFQTYCSKVSAILQKHKIEMRDVKTTQKLVRSFPYTATQHHFNGRDVFQSQFGYFFFRDWKQQQIRVPIILTKCHKCEKECFAAKGNDADRRFCSDKCRYETIRGKSHPNWKGQVCKTRNGYNLIYRPDHPNAYKNKVQEHRVVVEKALGRYLRDDEVVHHINGIKTDNRFENLCLCTKSEHGTAHFSLLALVAGLIADSVIEFDPVSKTYKRCKCN